MSDNKSFLGADYFPETPASGEEKTLGLLAHVITFVHAFGDCSHN